MKRFSEQLHKKASTLKLRAAEKNELRERVVSYMEYHPLPKDMQVAKPVASPKLFTEEYSMISIPLALIGKMAAVAAVVVMVVVPFAAERAVPGDGLYAVKRFNEEVRSTLVFDTVQKVEWETERLNRRIAEARMLASEGKLTDEVEAVVAEAVRTHTKNAQKNIDVLRGEDADEATLASFALENTLTVQSAALQDEIADEDDSQPVDEAAEEAKPRLLAAVVEETRVEANASNASSTIPAFDKVMAKVEQSTTRVYELRDSLVGTATDEEINEINRRIEDVERTVAEAIVLRESDDQAARTLLIDSLQRVQKLVIFMTDIKVETVDIEEIVPVVLTDGEKQARLDTLNSEITDLVFEIEAALASDVDTDNAIIEKVIVSLDEIETLQASTSEEYLEAEALLLEALDLAKDTIAVLGIEVADDVPVDVVDTASSTEPVASTTDEVFEEFDDEAEVEVEDQTEETEVEFVATTTEATETIEQIPLETISTE